MAMKNRSREAVVKAVRYFLILLLLVFVLFPFFYMVSTAFKAEDDLFSAPPKFLPRVLTLSNFQQALQPKFIRYFMNSFIVTIGTTIIVIAVALFSSYAFSRLRFRGRKFLLKIIIFTQLFPLIVIIIPIYILYNKMRIVNTHLSLIIAYLAFTVPVGVWMLRGFFKNIPYNLEEAAMVDGCTRLTAFIRVVLPLARPGISATAVYIFIVTWQEFMFALTMLTGEKMRTLPVGILDFIRQYGVNWGGLMALSTLITVPVFILFLILQRQFISGLTQGSVKG
ncbi:MAG: carbohydrate ABC transporter permease [Spirochaetes bacterium]|nr:carbohydrate ABC transporter permease [Spirochaetota bacterium]